MGFFKSWEALCLGRGGLVVRVEAEPLAPGVDQEHVRGPHLAEVELELMVDVRLQELR